MYACLCKLRLISIVSFVVHINTFDEFLFDFVYVCRKWIVLTFHMPLCGKSTAIGTRSKNVSKLPLLLHVLNYVSVLTNKFLTFLDYAAVSVVCLSPSCSA